MTAPGTFAESVSVPASKDLTLQLPTGEVQVTGDFVTESPLTVTGAGPLAVEGEVVATGTGALAGTPTLRTGPTVPGTDGTGNDTGWRNLAFATNATGADLADDVIATNGILYTFDPFATGSGGSQGAFVPASLDAATTLPIGSAFWLYVFDDNQEPVTSTAPLALDTEAPYDGAQAPGTTFGAQTLAGVAPFLTASAPSFPYDCTTAPAGKPSSLRATPTRRATTRQAWAWAVRASRARRRPTTATATWASPPRWQRARVPTSSATAAGASTGRGPTTPAAWPPARPS